MSGLLGSGPASAATPITPEPHTALTALPDRTRVDGTAPLWVRLSGVPAPDSPRPSVSPTVAGAWSTVGTRSISPPPRHWSRVPPTSSRSLPRFRPPAKLRLARPHDRAESRLPTVKAFQQALARLGYLPYTFHSIYESTCRWTGVQEHGRSPRLPSADRRAERQCARRAPLDYGRLDETTQGALTVFEGAHGSKRPNPPASRTPASGRACWPPRRTGAGIRAPIRSDRHGVLARDPGGTQGNRWCSRAPPTQESQGGNPQESSRSSPAMSQRR